MVSYNNPLADVATVDDVEAGRSFMPPLPHLTIDRVLRRAAERLGVSKVIRLWVSLHANSSDFVISSCLYNTVFSFALLY
jgi:hypothetical protein